MEVPQVGLEQQASISWKSHAHKIRDEAMQDTPMHDFF
jgi:hypothetical protein